MNPPTPRPPTSRRPPLWLIALLFALSFVPLALSMFNGVLGDTGVYRRYGDALLSGQMPYRDFSLEYPPWALAWFVLPTIGGTIEGYKTVFAAQMIAVDAVAKAVLLIEGVHWLKGWRRLFPFALFVVAGLFQEYIYLKRFDLVPATMVLVAVSLLCRDRGKLAGVMLAIAIGTKAYPLLLVPAFLAAARQRGQGGPFLRGLIAGTLPLLCLAPLVPWWEFMTLHRTRGLQVESLGASLLWLAQHYELVQVEWFQAPGSFELRGPLVGPVLTATRALLAVTTLGSVALAARAAWRGAAASPAGLARLALLPIVAFVAFNSTFSPQYFLWLMGLVALALIGGWTDGLKCLTAACLFSRFIFPSPTYRAGLSFDYSVLLCARDLLVVFAWLALFVEAWKAARSGGAPSSAPAA